MAMSSCLSGLLYILKSPCHISFFKWDLTQPLAFGLRRPLKNFKIVFGLPGANFDRQTPQTPGPPLSLFENLKVSESHNSPMTVPSLLEWPSLSQ